MELRRFFRLYFKKGSLLLGIVSVDIIGHSQWQKGGATTATCDQLRHLIELQLAGESAAMLPWRGDGAEVLFNISEGCDSMLLFADRLLSLIPAFNRAKHVLSFLEHDLAVRVICHVGELTNRGGPQRVYGSALNDLCKCAKIVAVDGRVTLSRDVMVRLSQPLQARCTESGADKKIGKFFAFGIRSANCVSLGGERWRMIRAWEGARDGYEAGAMGGASKAVAAK